MTIEQDNGSLHCVILHVNPHKIKWITDIPSCVSAVMKASATLAEILCIVGAPVIALWLKAPIPDNTPARCSGNVNFPSLPEETYNVRTQIN